MASSVSTINVIIIRTFLGLFIYSNCLINLITIVDASRADLATYLHIAPSAAVEEKAAPEELYVLAFINYTYVANGKEVFYSEEKGRYGEGRILNVQGYLEHITAADNKHDHTACTTQLHGTNGTPLPSLNSGKPWIALIRRGKCTFEEKIKNAWRHGAVGVIVYNEIPAVSLEKMKVVEKDRNITAIFTYKWIGEELGRIIDEGNHIWVSISEGQRGMKPQHNINKTSVLFVSISFIVLMIISLVWLIFYYIQRFRYLQSKDQHSRHLCAVAKRVIMKIPTKSGKCNEDSDNDCCAICIELYKATDCIRVLPCKHEFHKNCIDPWLLEHRTCPMCKLDVLKHYGFMYIGSQESIFQLDLDMEIGDHDGLNSGDDDRFSIDNPRISHTTPAFHIQQFDDHSHLVRDLSIVGGGDGSRQQVHLQPEGGEDDDDRIAYPERSQSALSCINRMFDETITNKILSSSSSSYNQQQKNYFSSNSSSKDKANTTTMKSGANFLYPDNCKKDKESRSLPGTLKKKRSSTTDSCRGSNNCYTKAAAAADLKHCSTVTVKIEKGCPKLRAANIRRRSSDVEHLLDSTDDSSSNADITIGDSDHIPRTLLPSSVTINAIPMTIAAITIPSSSSSSSTATAAAVVALAPTETAIIPKIQIDCRQLNDNDDNGALNAKP